MKKDIIEQIIAAAPENSFDRNDFTSSVMTKIRLESNLLDKKSRQGLLHRVKKLHGFALVVFVVLSISALSGITYAAVRFIPELLKINSTTTDDSGRKNYFLDDFTACQRPEDAEIQHLKRFATASNNSDLTDEEVLKILQAKCQLLLIDKLVREKWPTYQTNDGTLSYAYANIIVNFESINKTSISYYDAYYDPESTGVVTREIAKDTQFKAYSMTGEALELDQINKGDAVFLISQHEETETVKNPSFTGLSTIGLVKMPLPVEYYTSKQMILTEIPACIGNIDEFCPSTPSIDIYPRGEEQNQMEPLTTENIDMTDWVTKTISGEVTEVTDEKVLIKSSAGAIFTLALSRNIIDEYNKNYTQAYIEGGTDAEVRVGSSIEILYSQPAGSDSRLITDEHVMAIKLMLAPSVGFKKTPNDQYSFD